MRTCSFSTGVLLGASALSLAACFEHHTLNENGPDLSSVGEADAGTECEEPAQPASRELDLLLVMDDSGSMKEEQAKVLAQLPRLVRGLESRDISLHLGVVSTNLGGAGMLDHIASCRGEGDDGVLIDETRSEDPACADPADEAAEFGCLAALGTDGCGVEQPLEAMWKALAPRSDDSFVSGHGHGDEANEGFLRPDATLAVLIVTDEVDCSIREAGKPLFDEGDDSFRYDGPEPQLHGQPMGINFRCAYPSSEHLLSPIARYVEGLRNLKADPDRVLLSVIAGIPTGAEDLHTIEGTQDFGAILALPEMQIAPGTDQDVVSHDALPRPACSAENGIDGSASPARRFVQLAAGLETTARVWSICGASYERAFSDLIARASAPSESGCGVE